MVVCFWCVVSPQDGFCRVTPRWVRVTPRSSEDQSGSRRRSRGRPSWTRRGRSPSACTLWRRQRATSTREGEDRSSMVAGSWAGVRRDEERMSVRWEARESTSGWVALTSVLHASDTAGYGGSGQERACERVREQVCGSRWYLGRAVMRQACVARSYALRVMEHRVEWVWSGATGA